MHTVLRVIRDISFPQLFLQKLIKLFSFSPSLQIGAIVLTFCQGISSVTTHHGLVAVVSGLIKWVDFLWFVSANLYKSENPAFNEMSFYPICCATELDA